MSLSLRYLDPRRSLAAAIGWLVLALSLGLALVASAWVGEIAAVLISNSMVASGEGKDCWMG
ncbi:hypothetical protein, partial [Candidatus Accumulibacter aalborgensis]|uniref:hypothetical protein n=1 Tax=Candidatus Accumulibacter aalborgensis TaxID=1860102 RepID=UPI001C8FFD5E